MLMEHILLIADYILRIWWALSILLLVVILCYLVSIMHSLYRTVSWIKQQIKSVEQSVMAPMSMINSFLSWWMTTLDDEFDD